MPFLVRTRGSRWEIRESIRTDRGPRSRTLASFARLSPAVLRHAQDRAGAPFNAADVVKAARQAAVPVDLDPAEASARTLISHLSDGARISPALAGVLASLLPASGPAPVSDAAKSAGAWVAATAQERGETLHDLLLLADALPAPRTSRPQHFPVLHSVAA